MSTISSLKQLPLYKNERGSAEETYAQCMDEVTRIREQAQTRIDTGNEIILAGGLSFAGGALAATINLPFGMVAAATGATTATYGAGTVVVGTVQNNQADVLENQCTHGSGQQ
jgi:hypothetical protein